MKLKAIVIALSVTLAACASVAEKHHAATDATVSDQLIVNQNAALAKNTESKGFGPQSPRDIDSSNGSNARIFNAAPAYSEMNLCNIHFHKNAEHKGGEYIKYAGNGDGNGFQTGYTYSGQLSTDELKPSSNEVCSSEHGGLASGDTIEVHYVHSSAQVKPGATLKSCLSDTNINPQLRAEAQVYVLVNDKNALNFIELTKFGEKNGRYQALNIPNNTGTPIQYAGSTTGPSYNEQGSPLLVSWSVRPKVAKVNIDTVAEWCKGNAFNENHAHGVRNLVTNPDLLSPIKP